MALKKNSSSRQPIIQEGRGLSALLAKLNVGRAARNDEIVALDEVAPDPNQPRKIFSEAQMNELAESIKLHGLLQPLIVTPDSGGDAKYKIVAGERRYQACKAAGLKEVPVKIVRGDSRTLDQIQLVENLQREDLTVLETASALRELTERYNITQEELAAGIGWNRSAVSNKIRILSLPKDVLDMMAEGKLTEGHAKALLSLVATEKVEEFARNCVKNNWSVKALSERVEYANTHKKTVMFAAPPYKAWRPKGATELAQRLGIKIGASGDGTTNRVVLHGLSGSQVERLLEVLGKAADVLNPSAAPAKKTRKKAAK